MNHTLKIEASEKDTQCLIEALLTLDDKFSSEIAISTNDQEIALLQNDQAYLRIVLNDIKKRGVALFGDDILNFDRTPL